MRLITAIQVKTITKPGKYRADNGLYLTVKPRDAGHGYSVSRYKVNDTRSVWELTRMFRWHRHENRPPGTALT